MRSADQKGMLSVTSSIVAAVVALALFVASGVVIRRFPSITSSSGAFGLDFVVPGALLCAAYWAIFHASPYLRPRTLWRACGFVVLSLGLAMISWWVRVAVLGSLYGM
jgi:hypothetical protein